MILLDTNVISEVIAARPAPTVVSWMSGIEPTRLWTTAVTAAELRAGAAALDDGKRKTLLVASIEGMLSEFEGKILPFDERASVAFAEISAFRRRAGRSWSNMDLLIAAIAKTAGAIVATRNTSDFDEIGVEIINPWETALSA